MEAVFLKLVNMSISAGWLILAVMVLRLLLRKAPKNIRVVLWGLVGFRLICPVSIESMFSLLPSSEPLPEEFLYADAPEVASGIPAVNQVINPIITESLSPMPGASANPTQVWSFIFSQVWILGVVLMLGYALISYLLLRRKVAASMRLDDNLRLCDHIASPFILGIFRPVIYLPSELDPKTADMVLAHEKAHIRRKDHWWKPLGFALLCVYWFNPLIWLGYILLCRDIELACDERVIAELGEQDKKEYASALLRCSVSRLHIAACPLAFGEVGVKDRIKTVLNYKKPAFWMIVAAVILCVVVAVCFLTDPVKKVDPLTLDDWGITITAHDPSPTGVILAYHIPDNLDGEITIPINQTLLKTDGDTWTEVPALVFHDRYNWAKWLPADQDETRQQLDWSVIYGTLPPGKYSIRKTLWLHQDGLGYQKDFYADFSIPMKERIAEGTYVVSELLYRNPLSSYFPDESDTPATVEIHSGCNILTASGGTLEENPNIIWGWRKLDESGEDVAFTLRLLEHEGKLTLSEDTLYQKISEHYHLLQLGEELLLVHSEHDETLWSVYCLVKAQPIGSENMTLYSEYGHAIRILTAQHYSNGITLQLQVTFPESIELSDRDVPYPQDVWLYYATESGRTHADAMYLHSQTIDEETHSVLYDLSFSLDQEPPTGREITLSLSGFRNNQSNTLFSTPLSMTWSGEVTEARVYEYRDNDTHIHMTLSPISFNINAKGTNFQSMDELYNALIILDVFGNQITTPNGYSGSQGGSLIDIEILPGVPINMNNIGSISIGEYKLVCTTQSGIISEFPDAVAESWQNTRDNSKNVVYVHPETGEYYDSSTKLDYLIRQTILNQNHCNDSKNGVWLESHAVLGELVACGVSSSGETICMSRFFILAQISEVAMYDGEITVLSSRTFPVILSVTETADREMTVTDYWQAEDDADPEEALNANFPDHILEAMDRTVRQYSREFELIILIQARYYFGIFPWTVVGEIFEDIARNQPAISMNLVQDGQRYQTLEAWGSLNHVQFASSLCDFSFVEISETEAEKKDNWTSIGYLSMDTNLSIIFYEGTKDIQVWSNNDIHYYRATYLHDETKLISDIVHDWFDEAEYYDLLDQWILQAPLVYDNGQDAQTAAQEFCQRYEYVKLKTNPGSAYRYSFVKCDVEIDIEATNLARARGELDENGYAFRLTVTFVPDNERALHQSMPGNTHKYSGDDPEIPADAYIYYRCGYITQTEYGWVGQILGTSF